MARRGRAMSLSLIARTSPAKQARDGPTHLPLSIVAQDRPAATVLRRTSGWREEEVEGTAAMLDLPEVGVVVPLSEIYPG